MLIGFGPRVPCEAVRVILPPKGRIYAGTSAPRQRFIQRAEAEGRLVNAAHGRKVLSLIITDSNQVVLSAVAPETLWGGRRTKNGRRRSRSI
jgi:hypothetical protein